MTGGFSHPPRRQERDGLTSGRSRRHCRRERDLPSNPDVKTHRFAGTKARPHRTLRRRRGHADVASPPALRLPVGGRPQRYERYALDCPGVAHLAVLFLEEHRLAPSARCQSVSALAALPSSVVRQVRVLHQTMPATFRRSRRRQRLPLCNARHTCLAISSPTAERRVWRGKEGCPRAGIARGDGNDGADRLICARPGRGWRNVVTARFRDVRHPSW
jgi:hypothetical protein